MDLGSHAMLLLLKSKLETTASFVPWDRQDDLIWIVFFVFVFCLVIFRTLWSYLTYDSVPLWLVYVKHLECTCVFFNWKPYYIYICAGMISSFKLDQCSTELVNLHCQKCISLQNPLLFIKWPFCFRIVTIINNNKNIFSVVSKCSDKYISWRMEICEITFLMKNVGSFMRNVSWIHVSLCHILFFFLSKSWI